MHGADHTVCSLPLISGGQGCQHPCLHPTDPTQCQSSLISPSPLVPIVGSLSHQAHPRSPNPELLAVPSQQAVGYQTSSYQKSLSAPVLHTPVPYSSQSHPYVLPPHQMQDTFAEYPQWTSFYSILVPQPTGNLSW